MTKYLVRQFTTMRDTIDDALGHCQYALMEKHTSEQDTELMAVRSSLLEALNHADAALQFARKDVQVTDA